MTAATEPPLPAGMNRGDPPVIVFDGLCVLCSANARFVLRNPIYRWVAHHRYRLFGRREACWLPSLAQRGRILP